MSNTFLAIFDPIGTIIGGQPTLPSIAARDLKSRFLKQTPLYAPNTKAKVSVTGYNKHAISLGVIATVYKDTTPLGGDSDKEYVEYQTPTIVGIETGAVESKDFGGKKYTLFTRKGRLIMAMSYGIDLLRLLEMTKFLYISPVVGPEGWGKMQETVKGAIDDARKTFEFLNG